MYVDISLSPTKTCVQTQFAARITARIQKNLPTTRTSCTRRITQTQPIGVIRIRARSGHYGQAHAALRKDFRIRDFYTRVNEMRRFSRLFYSPYLHYPPFLPDRSTLRERGGT